MGKTKELTYQVECGPEDILYTFVYEIEPYDPGYWRDKNGDGCPPSGGYASVYEVRNPDGSALPQDSWKAAGIDVEKIEDAIYVDWCDSQGDDDPPDPMDD
jgi:hypothetical protein